MAWSRLYYTWWIARVRECRRSLLLVLTFRCDTAKMQRLLAQEPPKQNAVTSSLDHTQGRGVEGG